MPISLTPLDPWIAERIGAGANGPGGAVAAADVRAYQLGKLGEMLEYVKARSAFYASQLENVASQDLRSYADLENIPFMTHEDLRAHGQRMLCVGQDEVARIVTLHSSGTTGKPKRLFFTEQDLERTIDFFHNGIQTLVRPGERMLILLPGKTPDSTGDLLARGMARMGAEGVIHGLVQDPRKTLEAAREDDVQSLVGFPVQILNMARLDAQHDGPRLSPQTLLLCSDYVPQSIVAYLEKVWGCEVYSHWGTVETGLGGGVECGARRGCHLRQADLLLEIIDPYTLRPLPDGSWGEIVITTLTRQAMPVIRYRTGDLGRLLSDRCACGSTLVRLDKVQGRMADSRLLSNGHTLRLSLLDEILFAQDAVMDYQARLQSGGQGELLIIQLGVLHDADAQLTQTIRSALESLPELQDTNAGRGPRVAFLIESGVTSPYAAAKRILIDERN